jgi:cytochrome c oxidase cbb3-type subunit 3
MHHVEEQPVKPSVTGAFILAFAVAAASQSPAFGQRNRAAAAPGAAPQAPRITNYPARAKAPQDVLDRGKAQFGLNCAFCHGSDAGGGEVGPNLKRSGVVLEDQNGELIEPIVHGARVAQGMPRLDLTNDQISDIAAWLHSLAVTARTDPNAENINIVVGDNEAGRVYFDRNCASCHSATGDLKGFATKFPNPKAMQQWWLMPGAAARGAAATLVAPKRTATVTLAGGQKVEGTLTRLDDFGIWLTLPDGSVRSFDRAGNVPKVDIHNPLEPHVQLLLQYSDKDIHDVTAYLETLK